jgi:hypothetical protein
MSTRSPSRSIVVWLLSVVTVSLLALGRAGGAYAAPPVLYAATGAGTGSGCGGSLSSLYTLDPGTAAATLVGPITIGVNQVRHVTGLAVHPSTGTLYGFMNGQDPNCSDFGLGTLITIDKATGAASVVGSTGAAAIQSPDITYDPFGNLFAWSENSDDLVALNTSTGTSTLVGDCSCNTASTGLASDSSGRMYMKSGSNLFRVSPFTGHVFSSLSLSTFNHNILAFGPSDVLYTGMRAGSPAFTLRTIDLSTGVTTDVGTNSVDKISALAWDLGTVTAPDVADLSLTKIVDDPSPSDWFTEVTFTITVSNSGPATATGVVVDDALPAGLTYVSDDGGGAYDSSSGVWTVGSIGNGNAATLHITASVQPFGSHVNAAEVSASSAYDSDSVPGSGEGDTFVTAPVTPTADPNVDASVSIEAKVPKSTKTSSKFTVLIRNVGSANFTVSSANLDDVEVNSSTNTVVCKLFSKTVKPGKTAKVKCAFNPLAIGVTPGSSVTFSARVDLPADGYTGNDIGTATLIAT